MKRRITIADRYYRARSQYWRIKRLLFPSPAETRFIELMGGKVFIIDRLKSSSGFPMAIVLSRGKILREAKMKREVRYGKHYVDFANDLNWIIELDGTYWHQDIVADMDREIYINEMLRKNPYGMRLLRVRAPRIWNDRTGLQNQIIDFLSK